MSSNLDRPSGPYILGLWDGHDSGAALLKGDRLVFAINEERLTRRKLEIKFPENAIKACLAYARISPQDVQVVAYSTTDFAKTLTRTIPSLKEEYYQVRRRKKAPSCWTPFVKKAKYRLTEIPPNPLTRAVSDWIIRREIERLGFHNSQVQAVDHHLAHAAGVFFSGFKEALVITLDGIGDGLSGTLSRFEGQKLTPFHGVSGKQSMGIFFEHVTTLMNMRELEDEGKVMALANFAYPVPDEKNPMLNFFTVEGTHVHGRYSSLQVYEELKKILWQFPSEQFCYMAQRALEKWVVEWSRNAVRETGFKQVVFSGGVASNIKVNQQIRLLGEVDDLFVFPCMGDGGLALGAASLVNATTYGTTSIPLKDLYAGPEYSDDQIYQALEPSGLKFTLCENAARTIAPLIAKGEIVFWFQGRMELGPRALGARSILALPNSLRIKDQLNLTLKKRVWYQPFCPSMLLEDARVVLSDFERGAPNRFMTSGYRVKDSYRERLAGIVNVDGSCRPQILDGADESSYEQLLQEIKKLTGLGILLNTSLNIHGEPLACSPEDAIRALRDSGCRFMMIGHYLVEN